MFDQFVLLKDTPQSILDSILSQNELYAKCYPSDITSLPEINLKNFVNICNFVDYYQLIYDTEFIANIQYHILCKHKEVTNNINFIPLNIQQKVYQNPCLKKMECGEKTIKHIACYKFLDQTSLIIYTIDNAIYDDNLEMIKYLFKSGEDCSERSIDYASSKGHLEIVKYLFEVQNKDCTDDAIYLAIIHGHLEIVQYLIEVQHKKYEQKTLKWAKKHDIVEYLKSHPDSCIQ